LAVNLSAIGCGCRSENENSASSGVIDGKN
jgi:hypothetical protein